MSRDDFTAALESELQLRSVPFSRADLLTFVADVWPLAEDDADVAKWADAFVAVYCRPQLAGRQERNGR
jgi:hypothetical protein